jgi:hypothetical protein
VHTVVVVTGTVVGAVWGVVVALAPPLDSSLGAVVVGLAVVVVVAGTGIVTTGLALLAT